MSPEIAKTAMWGTFGRGGAEHCAGSCPEHQLRWVRLEDCETDHLQMILKNQRHIYDTIYADVIHSILTERGVEPEKFSLEAEADFFRYDAPSLKKNLWRFLGQA